MTPDQIAEMHSMNWWHKIDLGNGVETPGKANHTAKQHASLYFGMPEDLTGKTVLDIGCSDGMFSFEAERRGARSVIALDTSDESAACLGKPLNWPTTINFAKEVLGSKITIIDSDFMMDWEELWDGENADIVLFYDVLYHLQNPIGALHRLFALTNEMALIETAVSSMSMAEKGWEFRPGHHGDPTNQWYPSIPALLGVLRYVGFREAKLCGEWPGCERVTVRALK